MRHITIKLHKKHNPFVIPTFSPLIRTRMIHTGELICHSRPYAERKQNSVFVFCPDMKSTWFSSKIRRWNDLAADELKAIFSLSVGLNTQLHFRCHLQALSKLATTYLPMLKCIMDRANYFKRQISTCFILHTMDINTAAMMRRKIMMFSSQNMIVLTSV